MCEETTSGQIDQREVRTRTVVFVQEGVGKVQGSGEGGSSSETTGDDRSAGYANLGSGQLLAVFRQLPLEAAPLLLRLLLHFLQLVQRCHLRDTGEISVWCGRRGPCLVVTLPTHPYPLRGKLSPAIRSLREIDGFLWWQFGQDRGL